MDRLKVALAAYDRACQLPNNIPEMQSWESRKDSAREAAQEALQATFDESELESLYYLTKELFPEEEFCDNA